VADEMPKSLAADMMVLRAVGVAGTSFSMNSLSVHTLLLD
jgi:hypothetical protein